MRWLLVIAAVSLSIPGAARAQTRIIDGHTARARGLEPADLSVRVGRVTVEQGVEHFLAVAGQRGARYVGGLHWVWASVENGMTLQCTALLEVFYDRRGRLSIGTGPSHCLPAPRGGRASWTDEVRGEMYLRRGQRLSRDEIDSLALLLEPSSRRLSRGEMRSLSRLLEPEKGRRVRRYRRRARPARRYRRQVSPRELDSLVRELE